jgi:hypothetical protein
MRLGRGMFWRLWSRFLLLKVGAFLLLLRPRFGSDVFFTESMACVGAARDARGL